MVTITTRVVYDRVAAGAVLESRGFGRGPHRGDLRNLRARDSLT